MGGNSHGTFGKDQAAAILAENLCEATRLAGFEQILGMIAESDNGVYKNRNGDEPPGSRPHRRSDFHLRFHPFADPFGGTAVRDVSLGRVPHSNLFFAEQIQIIQQFWAEGSTFTRSTRLSVGSLLSFSIRTDRIVRVGERVNHDIHSLFYRQHL